VALWAISRGTPGPTQRGASPDAGIDELPPSWGVFVKKLANPTETANAEVRFLLTEPEARRAGVTSKTLRLVIDFKALDEDRTQYIDDWKQSKAQRSVRYVRQERKEGRRPLLDGRVEPFAKDKEVMLPAFADPGRDENRDLYKTSLVITHLDVVEDARAEGMGPWSFGYLMTQLANERKPEVSPSAFVSRWLEHWVKDKTVNGETVLARPELAAYVTAPWQARSGEGKPLDLAKAPFRLLAIVNRLDLRKNLALTGLGLDPGRDGAGEAGEVRFIFCAVNRNCQDEPLPFTVIFEYAIKKQDFAGVREWVRQWDRLKKLTPGTKEYNQALEDLTNQVTQAGSDAEAPNGSALAQVRTNTLFGFPWELREFRIGKDSNLLEEVPVTDTPCLDRNNTRDISKYLLRNLEAILGERHQLPVDFPLGGSSTAYENRFWKGPADVKVNLAARRFFSLSTCSGCHAGEGFPPFDTQNGKIDLTSLDPPPHFTHVRPRARGKEAMLSRFLTGDGNGTPLRLTDPVSKKSVDRFELERRANDMGSLLRYGLVYELQRMHLPAVH
jgi:hypothetical protein